MTQGHGSTGLVHSGAVGGAPQSASAKGPVSRFSSFAERYVIERASTFEAGKEKEQAWSAMLDAEKVFEMIERHDKERTRRQYEADLREHETAIQALQQAQGAAQQMQRPPLLPSFGIGPDSPDRPALEQLEKIYQASVKAGDQNMMREALKQIGKIIKRATGLGGTNGS